MSLPPLPPAIRAFLDRALPLIQENEDIVGLTAGGSFITATLDEYSDLDLIIAIRPEAYTQFFARAKDFIGQFGNPLSLFSGEHVGEPRLWICIFAEDLLHVDFKLIKLPDFEIRVEDPVILWERDNALTDIIAQTKAHFPIPSDQWWEDRFWTWIYYMAQKLARGELFECYDGLAFLRGLVLGPMLLVKNGEQPRGVRFIEKVAAAEMPQLLATTSNYHPADLKRALMASADLYRKIRKPAGENLVYCEGMEQAAMEYLAKISV